LKLKVRVYQRKLASLQPGNLQVVPHSLALFDIEGYIRTTNKASARVAFSSHISNDPFLVVMDDEYLNQASVIHDAWPLFFKKSPGNMPIRGFFNSLLQTHVIRFFRKRVANVQLVFDADDPNVISIKSNCRTKRDEKGSKTLN